MFIISNPTASKVKKKDLRSISSEDTRLLAITRYAIYTLLIFSPLARASVQGWAIAVIHIITLFAFTAFLLNNCLTWKWKWIKTPLDKPILALLALSIISAAFSKHPPASFRAMMLFVNDLLVFYLTVHTIRTRSQFRQVIYIILGMAVFLSVFGLFKQSGINPFSWWHYTDLNQDGYRLTATFGNPDHLAGYMEMAALLTLGLVLVGFRYIPGFFMACFIFLMLIALIFSLSRGGWIGFVAGWSFMTVLLLKNRHFKKRRLLLGLSGLFLAAAFLILSSTSVVERIRTLDQGEDMPNFANRAVIWKSVAKIVQDYPLLGTGPGTFSLIFTQYQPGGQNARYFMGHNDYLQFTSEVGIFLIAIILWMMVNFYKKGFKKMKSRSSLVRGSAAGIMSGITAILVHSIGDFNLHIPANALLFTVLAALASAPSPDVSEPQSDTHGFGFIYKDSL
jgi:O-antigen ligase